MTQAKTPTHSDRLFVAWALLLLAARLGFWQDTNLPAPVTKVRDTAATLKRSNRVNEPTKKAK